MAVIGITGSIASGKSTFTATLAALLSAEVFDADKTAKNLLASEGVRQRVTETLGDTAYLPDGTTNRTWLREKIFSDPQAKTQLEAILHPLVRKTWVSLTQEERFQTEHLLVDIPLLFETSAEAKLPNIVVIACSADVQRERLLARGLSPDSADRIVASQMPQKDKISRAHYVVWNDGSLHALELQAETVGLFAKMNRLR